MHLKKLLLLVFLLLSGCSHNEILSSYKFSEIEIVLNDIYKLKIITKRDSSDTYLEQRISFLRNQTILNSSAAKDLMRFPLNGKIHQAASIEIKRVPYYLLYMNAANGEPEYYALIDTIGNLSGYNKCYADTCSVSITAKDVDSAAIFNYFRDDKMGVEFKDVF